MLRVPMLALAALLNVPPLGTKYTLTLLSCCAIAWPTVTVRTPLVERTGLLHRNPDCGMQPAGKYDFVVKTPSWNKAPSTTAIMRIAQP
jgi:hypothetical protein